MYVPARSLVTILATIAVAAATPLAIQSANSAASASSADFQYVTRTSTNDSSPSREVIARCPSGMAALGGGAYLTNAAGQAILTEVLPEKGPDGYRLKARATEDVDGYDGNWWLTATAVCGQPPAGLEYIATKGTATKAASPVAADCGALGKRLIGTGFWNTDRSSVSAMTPTAQAVQVTSSATRLAPDAAEGSAHTGYAICATTSTGFSITSASSATDSVQTKSATAVCPAGTRIRSAGAALPGATTGAGSPTAVILDDLAVLPDFNAARVVAYADQTGIDRPWSAQAYAVCG